MCLGLSQIWALAISPVCFPRARAPASLPLSCCLHHHHRHHHRHHHHHHHHRHHHHHHHQQQQLQLCGAIQGPRTLLTRRLTCALEIKRRSKFQWLHHHQLRVLLAQPAACACSSSRLPQLLLLTSKCKRTGRVRIPRVTPPLFALLSPLPLAHAPVAAAKARYPPVTTAPSVASARPVGNVRYGPQSMHTRTYMQYIMRQCRSIQSHGELQWQRHLNSRPPVTGSLLSVSLCANCHNPHPASHVTFPRLVAS